MSPTQGPMLSCAEPTATALERGPRSALTRGLQTSLNASTHRTCAINNSLMTVQPGAAADSRGSLRPWRRFGAGAAELSRWAS